MANWIGPAVEKMKAKGTLGSFGKATAKNIARGKKAGGARAKKAVFADNMRKIAARRKSGRGSYGR